MFEAFGLAVGKELSAVQGRSFSAVSVPQTVLRREADGTVTVLSLADVYKPILTRQPDGSVTVGVA